MFKLAINGILKNKTFLKVSAIYLGIWQMLVKIRKRNVDMYCPCCWGFRQRVSWQFFLRILYLVDSLSVEIVWIDKLHYFHRKFISLTMVAIEIGKKAISKLPQQWLLRGKKASSKTWRFKLLQQKLSWLDQCRAGWNIPTSKIYIFRKRTRKLKTKQFYISWQPSSILLLEYKLMELKGC